MRKNELLNSVILNLKKAKNILLSLVVKNKFINFEELIYGIF